MTNALTHLHPLGIILATFAVMMLGWLWFELMFGRVYAVVLGRQHLPKTKTPPFFIFGPALCMLVCVVTSAVLMRALGVATLGGALAFGSVVGLGYLGATAVNLGINPNIPRPLSYGFLSAGYFFVASLLISVVLYLVG